VLDLKLPRLDGIAILKDVRSREAQLPILILRRAAEWKIGFSAWIAVRMTIW